MEKAKQRLTAQNIEGLTANADGTRAVYWDSDVRGLCLRVTREGTKTFSIFARVNRRAFRMTLKKFEKGIYTLGDARKAARQALHQAAVGINPVEALRRSRDAGTFGELADSFLKATKGEMRRRTHAEWTRLLEHKTLSGLRAMKVPDISRSDIIKTLEHIRSRSIAKGGRGIMANRNLEAIRRVFNWALSKDLVQSTPCLRVTKPTKEMQRHRSYTDDELKAIIAALDDTPLCEAVSLCMLTGVRIHTSLDAPWSEFNLDTATWLIDGQREGTKNGLPWSVPLAPSVVGWLKRRREARPNAVFVFGVRGRDGKEKPATRSSVIINRVREASGVADFTPHDLRRTINTWLASRVGGAEPIEVRDSILGHRPRGLEGVYNVNTYDTEKRGALERWAAHVERLAKPETAKVVPIRAAVAS